jgi:transcription antitermination factor NusG
MPATLLPTLGENEARASKDVRLGFMRSSVSIASEKAIPPGSITQGPSSGERWYVVHTLPQQEAQAEYQLRRQGFRPFLPRLIRTVRHARKLRNVRAPAFSRYLFVPLDLSSSGWTPINGTIGVSRLIMAHGKPQPVPPGVVETLIENTDGAGILQFGENLQVGQAVQILSGPFAHAIGELERLNANGRVRVLLDIMNGRISATLSRSRLKPV